MKKKKRSFEQIFNADELNMIYEAIVVYKYHIRTDYERGEATGDDVQEVCNLQNRYVLWLEGKLNYDEVDY